MSTTKKSQLKQPLLTVLVLLLLLLASVQAWHLYQMKQQLEVLHNQQPSAQLQAQEANLNRKEMAGENNTIEPANEQPPSLHTNQQVQPAQPQQKTVAPANEQHPPLHTNQQVQPAQPQQKTAAPAIAQQPSLHTNQQVQPAQPQQKAVSPATTAPLVHKQPSDSTFGGQAWNPYGETERMRMRRDRDKMFDRRFNNYTNNPGFRRSEMNKPGLNNRGFQYNFSQTFSTPEMDVKENAHQYMVTVNLPGANESDISVTLNGQRLTIKGKQEHKKQNRDSMGNTVFQVRQSGSFQRSITLSKPVKQNKIKTHLSKGVLTVTIPKIKNSQWR